jgi:hypothetical protein
MKAAFVESIKPINVGAEIKLIMDAEAQVL